MSKLSFQYGFSVFLMTEVVRVCSPPIVATANGSGNPKVASSVCKYNGGVMLGGCQLTN